MKKIYLSISLLSFIILSIIGCEDYNKLTAPELNLGSADFTRFVAIGNSITAGYQSGTIYQSGQMYAYPNLIAQQVGTKFEMPYVSDPGLGGRMEIQSLSPFTIYYNTASGTPSNLNYAAPYNGLGVPGALLYDVLYATSSTTCASYVFGGIPNPYFDLILRNSSLNIGTQLQQTLVQNPTFVTLWIGNNDVLGYATSGGTSPAAPTDATTFGQLYAAIGQYLAQSGAKVVAANIPNVAAIPFFTTVGPQMVQSGVPVLVYFKNDNQTVSVASQNDLLTSKVLVTLKGSAYAPYIGGPTSKFYTDNGIPVPPNVIPDSAFGVNPYNPWPNALILDADEIEVANNAVTAFNTSIAGVAQNFGFGLVDVNSIFNSLRAGDFTGGTSINGITFKTTYVSGGLFSLDGVHPSNQAHGIVANEFIKVINTKYGASIPLIDVGKIPGSIYFSSKISYKQGYPIIPNEVFEHLLF
jgi:lysophospholipase L1-like esterase